MLTGNNDINPYNRRCLFMIFIWLIQVFWTILCDFSSPYIFFILLAVMGLLRFFMNVSEKNTLTKAFIVVGDIFQIYWEYLIFIICCLFAFPRGTVSDTMDGTEYYYDFENVITILILIPICFLLTFLPYMISRRLYNKYYSYRKMSANWIIPSKIISALTFTTYLGEIIYYFIHSIGILFSAVLVAHIVIFILITRSFFRKKVPCENNSGYSFMTKFLSVVLNIVLEVTAFSGARLGQFLIAPEYFISDTENSCLFKYITGIVISEIVVFLPYGLNLLLYKCLYRKNGLSKWWIFPAIVIGAGAFLIYWYGLTVSI